MQRILRWAVGLPAALAVIAFAVANRQSVTLSFDPVNPSAPYASLAMPLWLLFFAGIFTGVLAGWVGCWFAQARHRKRARDAQAEVARLLAEREALLKKAEPEPPANIVPMGTGWI